MFSKLTTRILYFRPNVTKFRPKSSLRNVQSSHGNPDLIIDTFLLLVVVLSIVMLEISVVLTVRLLLPTLRQSLLVLAIPSRLISIT